MNKKVRISPAFVPQQYRTAGVTIVVEIFPVKTSSETSDHYHISDLLFTY